jgi:hypothetical protein
MTSTNQIAPHNPPTERPNEQERTLKCQAILVRVMKLKKTLAHRDLVVEAIRQCKVGR